MENTFPENKRPDDKPLTIAHQDQYNEGRCTVAQLKLNTILGITYPQVPVTKAIMCSDPKSQILWLHLDSAAQARTIYSRAAQKKPEGFSVKTYTPHVAYDRKLAALERIKEIKLAPENVNKQYQIRLGKVDLELYTKETREAVWLKTPLAELSPDLPPLLVAAWTEERIEEERRAFFAKGKHQCTPPNLQDKSRPHMDTTTTEQDQLGTLNWALDPEEQGSQEAASVADAGDLEGQELHQSS